MSSSAEEFFYRFDKEPALQRAFLEDTFGTLAQFGCRKDEVDAIARRDVVAMQRMGFHPILLRNFCSVLKLDYIAALSSSTER